MLELDHITVKGFKSIASIEKLRLGAINVLIGPNGSGKSNFIGVFSFLNALRSGKLQDYVIRVGGADKVLHFGARETDKLHIDISFQDGTNRYEITLEPAGADDLVPGVPSLRTSGTRPDTRSNPSPFPFSRTVGRRGSPDRHPPA